MARQKEDAPNQIGNVMNKPGHVSELHVQGEWTHLVPQSPDLADYLRKNSGVKDYRTQSFAPVHMTL
jgi:hypothetical protein